MAPSASPTGPISAGRLLRPRCGHHVNAKRRGQRCGKDAPWKSPKADFSTALGNPAQSAGFPLSHSDDGGWMKFKNRTFHLLQKADILTCYEHTTKMAIWKKSGWWPTYPVAHMCLPLANVGLLTEAPIIDDQTGSPHRRPLQLPDVGNCGPLDRNSLCANRDRGGLPALRVNVVDHHVPAVINDIAMPVGWL